jgi:hypothetical protein
MCGLSTAFLFATLSKMYAGRTKPSQNSSMKPRSDRTPLIQKTHCHSLHSVGEANLFSGVFRENILRFFFSDKLRGRRLPEVRTFKAP